MHTFDSCLKGLTVVLLVYLFRDVSALTKPSSVRLEDNEYSGVIVAIHPDVEENGMVIESIKNMFIEASTVLFTATKLRSYFKNVTILVPDTWADNDSYDSPKNASFEGADVIIASRNPRFAPDPQQPAVPYTKHYEGCGRQAAHIHFTPEFLLDPHPSYGSLGRILVHEWGHYRWGLFDEYPDAIGDPDFYQEFYFDPETELYEATRCVKYGWHSEPVVRDEEGKYVTCEGNSTVGYENDCFSSPASTQPSVKASIMYGRMGIEELVEFCDSPNAQDVMLRHNAHAPNKHNRLCDSESSWEVMGRHVDFNNGNNLPRSPTLTHDVTPVFTVSRVRPARIVMILDTSGSMATENRYLKLADAARNFITSVALDGSYVGIVDFDSDGVIIEDLTMIDSDETRHRLAESVPEDANGGTCIGCGLQKGLEILTENDANPEGGVAVLISDGQDNGGNEDFRNEMKEEYVEAGVVIDAVAFSNTAEETLRDLVHETGGTLYLQTDDPGSDGLHAAFQATMERNVKEYDRRIVLLSESSFYNVSESKERGIFIDSTIGRKTAFEFSYFLDPIPESAALEVVLKSPSGERIDKTYPGYGTDETFQVVKVSINGIAEPGAWSFTVTNTYHSAHEIFTTVSSYASQEGVDPIIATAELSGSIINITDPEPFIAYAEIRQGFNPVIRANVFATIERPPDKYGFHYDPIILQLLDNGAGADITRDDGIYSRYFTNFTGVGYYGIKINIDNNDGSAVILLHNSTVPYTPYSGALPVIDPDELLSGNIPMIGNATLWVPGTPVPEPEHVQAPYFTRGVSGGSSRVPDVPAGWQPGDDITAPNKVIDLFVSASSFINGTVTLTFTAPGDDLDIGTATYYVFRRSESSLDLQINYTLIPAINDSDIIHGDPLSPAPFGVREEFMFQVPIPASPVVSYAFAMHAVDETGNEAKMSNVATAELREYIPQRPPITTTPPTPPSSVSPPVNYKLIIGLSVSGALLLCVIIILVAYHKSSRWRAKYDPNAKHSDEERNGAKEEHAYDNVCVDDLNKS
ncbi:Calcium-activated chloride channel regulator 4A [Holothuria leucospilota]|uniref:Calcium-activated chloride channel regulator 4A n=1 Tax=Holothuria leucospilota TaxID=206669 RepID=A0A9Q0YHL8_HOLLE|nr:Calcium-activated chloride channel regulator 4A [Holothuria leucospilota]